MQEEMFSAVFSCDNHIALDAKRRWIVSEKRKKNIHTLL